MKTNRALLTADRRLMLLAVFALGLASAAPAAQAQDEQDKPAAAAQPDAAASKADAAAVSRADAQAAQQDAGTPAPGSVGEVTVTGAQRRAIGVSAAKAADLAADAAKNEAWRKYRDGTPPRSRDPNDQSKDFPGLQTYVQH